MVYIRGYVNTQKIIFLISTFAMAGMLLVITTALTANASAGISKLANSSVLVPPPVKGIVNVGVTPNQLAAGGPLPGNNSVVLEEAKCAAAQSNPPGYPTLVPAEQYDSGRTKVYGCSQFLGSYTGPNQVYEYASPVQYYEPEVMVTRGINEMYVYGGGFGGPPVSPAPSGPYVAKINPGDLSQVWRTYLLNLNATSVGPGNTWMYIGGINVLKDGNIAVITNDYLYKLNGTTGAVEAALTLPSGNSSPPNTSWNGFAAWPVGTLVMKSLTRAPGCNAQALNVIYCPTEKNAPNSTVAVVDPKTWKVLDWLELGTMSGSRIAATVYNGKDYAYLGGPSNVYRFFWDGKNITVDKNWSATNLTKPGQTNINAATVAGDWVFVQTNNQPPSKVPMDLILISQANASKISRLTSPMPLAPGQQSYIPANTPMDIQNNMLVGADGGAGKMVGVKFNPVTGNMSVVWRANETTLGWFGFIGPAEKRVVVSTNIHPGTTMSDLKNSPPPNYTEQIQWRDAATGKLLAASDYHVGVTAAAQPTPGYGGLMYDLAFDGHIIAMQVLPKANTTSTTGSK
jgi:hypothetical protein